MNHKNGKLTKLIFSLFIFSIISMSCQQKQPTNGNDGNTDTNKGNIYGQVTDIYQMALSDASIKIVNKTQTWKTDNEGMFKIEGIDIGEVSITVSKAGYNSQTKNGIKITKGKSVILNFFLSSVDNMIKNSDFEMNPNPDSIYLWNPGWGEYSSCYTIDVMEKYSGKSSVKIQTNEEKVLWLFQNTDAQSVEAQKSYTLSAYIKLKNVTSSAGNGAHIALVFLGSNMFSIGDPITKFTTGTSAGWSKLEIKGTAPDGSNCAQIILGLHGKGSVWFDQVSFDKSP